MANANYRLLIFDLDGTLVDTAPDISSCANEVFRKLGHRERSMKDITQAIGRGVRDLMQRLIGPLDPADPKLSEAVDLFRKLYADNLVCESKLYPGVREALEGPLAPLKKALVTNKPHPHTIDILRLLDLSKYFDPVIGTGGDFPAKPDPAAVLYAMKKYGAAPEETIFIGDSSIDWETAKRASIEFAWVNYGYEDLSRQPPRVTFNAAAEWRALANGHFR